MKLVFAIIIIILAIFLLNKKIEGYSNVFKCDSSVRESCYNIHPAPGCNNGDIEHCVCNLDPFCCFDGGNYFGSWDRRCVNLAKKCNQSMGAIF